MAHHTNADFIPDFGVSCVPRAGLHGHGLGVIVCLGESLDVGEYIGVRKILNFGSLACAGFVSDAHRDPRLHSEEPRRSLLDVLNWNAVRECVVIWRLE